MVEEICTESSKKAKAVFSSSKKQTKVEGYSAELTLHL